MSSVAPAKSEVIKGRERLRRPPNAPSPRPSPNDARRRVKRAWADVWTKLVLAVLCSVLLFARQITHMAGADHRAEFQPDPLYRHALLCDVALLTVAATAFGWLASRSRRRWVRRGYEHLFVLVLGSEVLSVAPWIGSSLRASFLGWVVLAGVVLWSYVRGWGRLVRIARAAGLALSPAAPLILSQLAFWDDGRPSVSPAPITAPARAERPVILLLFDEWGFSRSTDRDGEYRDDLRNLKALAAQSFDFRGARSQSLLTDESVPHLLFQNASRLSLKGGRFSLDGGKTAVDASTPSLFRTAKSLGYETRLAGWHIPYDALFPGQLDSVVLAPNWPGLPGFGGQMALALALNLRYSYNPVVRALQRPVYLQEYARRVDAVTEEGGRVLAACRPDTFLFLHSPLPHFPMIYRPDGTHNNWEIGYRANDYANQTAYADAVLGQLLTQLRASGRFDDALVVVTSDHGWREDPDPAFTRPTDRVHRVPLIVKWPGQTTPRVVNGRFVTTRLGRLVELAMRGGGESEAARLIGTLLED